jgi:hypothetical protein
MDVSSLVRRLTMIAGDSEAARLSGSGIEAPGMGDIAPEREA